MQNEATFSASLQAGKHLNVNASFSWPKWYEWRRNLKLNWTHNVDDDDDAADADDASTRRRHSMLQVPYVENQRAAES